MRIAGGGIVLQTTSSARPPAIGGRQAIAWLALFFCITAVYFAWPVWRAFVLFEFNPNEPWNAWFADRAMGAGPLYPSTSDLIVNNYPPLSFYIVGLVSKLTGDAILAGRLVSLASTLTLGFAAYACLRALNVSRLIAALTGLWLVATLARFFSKYVGMNDPNLLALAAMTSGFAWFLHRRSRGLAVEPAIVAMVVAGFIKHNLFVFPIAALAWLLLTDKRSFVRASVTGAAAVAAGLGLCAAVYGMDFFHELLMPRPMAADRVFQLINKIQWFVPALVVWALWAWPNRKQGLARLTALLIALALASALAQSTGSGVSVNIYLELAVATAIALGIALSRFHETPLAARFGVARVFAFALGLLAIRLIASQQLEQYAVWTDHTFRDGYVTQAEATQREVERVRGLPGLVACSIGTVCYRAGKPFVIDHSWVGMRIRAGVLSPETVADVLKREGVIELTLPDPGTRRLRLF